LTQQILIDGDEHSSRRIANHPRRLRNPDAGDGLAKTDFLERRERIRPEGEGRACLRECGRPFDDQDLETRSVKGYSGGQSGNTCPNDHDLCFV
jgi:hypothetical protein